MRGDKPGGPVRWRMYLPVAPARVYRALDSDEGRASFWAESAVEHEGCITFRFANGSEHRARILERKPPVRFALEYFAGIATFELSETPNGHTDVLLVHDGIDTADWSEVHAGWLNVLFPLKAVLVFGVDLRNHDPGRSWDHGYADQ